MMRMDLSTQWLTDYRSAVTSADAGPWTRPVPRSPTATGSPS